MGSGNSGLYSGTHGSKSQEVSLKKTPLFSNTGHISVQSISANREYFYGKTVQEINSDLHKQGYTTQIRKSKHESSKAKIIVTANSDKHRNITQVQVSPGSSRHGDVPYVKISTNNAGKIKIIDANKSDYKTDGKETAIMFFRRKR